MFLKMNNKAFLSNANGFSVFKYNDLIIRFAAPYSLEKYISVKQWNNGYLVVMAKYSHNDTAEEEYIDLNPILKDLYLDPEKFLLPIKEVEIKYA